MLLFCTALPASAQNGTRFFDQIPVLRANDTLAMPWLGGLNNVQVNNLDLDGDGTQDLLVFDRSDGSLLPFLRTNAAGFEAWQYAPQFYESFPADSLRHFLRVRDYNADGFPDLFTGFQSGIRVWRNTTGQTGQLSFQLTSNKLQTSYSGFAADLYSNQVDLPDMRDIDGDGDLDILTYNVLGTRIEFHQNQSMQLYGSPDSLEFALVSDCWGHFAEIYDPVQELYDAELGQDTCQLEIDNNLKTAHTGGSVTLFRNNGDSLWDAIISDAGVEYMMALTNGGSPTMAEMTGKDTLFPSNDIAVALTTFPVATLADLNNDGVADMIVSPNDDIFCNDTAGVWLYHNVGQDTNPVFQRQGRRFLQGEMLDHGTGAASVWFDYDNDSDLDLLVSTTRTYRHQIAFTPVAALYRNTGTDSLPVLELVSNDILGLGGSPFTASIRGLAPAAFDYNQDGLQDLVFGTQDGKLRLYTNATTQPTNPLFVLEDSLFLNTDTLQIENSSALHLAPTTFDPDNDGDTDLLIGHGKGGFIFYKNEAQPGQLPVYEHVTNFLGKIDLRTQPGTISQASGVVADANDDGQLEIIATGSDGILRMFGPVTILLQDSFPQLAQLWPEPISTAPHLSLKQFGSCDTLRQYFTLGTSRGGLRILYHPVALPSEPCDTLTPRVEDQPVPEQPFREDVFALSPNPLAASAGKLRVQMPQGAEMSLYDLNGRRVLVYHSPGQYRLPPDLRPGVYIALFRFKGNITSRKLLLTN